MSKYTTLTLQFLIKLLFRKPFDCFTLVQLSLLITNLQNHHLNNIQKFIYKYLILKGKTRETFYSKILLHILLVSWFNNGNETRFRQISITITL